MGAFVDITGQKFGRLTVLGRAGKHACGVITWLCQCDCGEETTATAQNLKTGNTMSCGCVYRDMIEQKKGKIFSDPTTHGMSNSPEWVSYRAMIARCYNEKHHSYRHYGACGITVCLRWLESFENFFADMGARPSEKTLDRIRSSGNYEPGNCRWATPLEQSNNRKDVWMIQYRGRMMSLKNAYRESGYSGDYSNVKRRIKVLGMSAEEALT